MKFYPYVLLLSSLLAGCGPDQKEKQTGNLPEGSQAPQALQEIAMTINLKNDSAAIAKYKEYHRQPWPELVAANKAAGIQKARIYLHGRRLVMLLTVPKNWDSEKAGQAYANSSPKVKEWGKLMETFQEPVPEAKPGESWAPMELVYDYQE
jgi:L-rhamnose mutarotase